MIYLDSCILIYLLEAEPSKRRTIAQTIRQHATAGFYISPLSKLECLVMPTRQGNTSLLERYKRLLGSLKMLEITPDIYDEALEFRAFHNLKTPDALHMATALNHNCQEFWTNDLRLSKVTSQLSFRVLP
jgi:uncharacterized protein